MATPRSSLVPTDRWSRDARTRAHRLDRKAVKRDRQYQDDGVTVGRKHRRALMRGRQQVEGSAP
ncbi:hypothetical protein LUX12_13440 [Streptomyces somaliensis]|uniref:hypothetical protein n=1 Tax=Streptomyces somaliensis TaxID=78355 RepID=UPI0020CDFA28|nr:hypothetical protein [Streptomyces somaliensis]MCP9945576.1 hypothetical protein [Streptomyces somaliensis]MCP9961241.1 hypothetical protein [Streptomyces somaliensis]MCP9974040.1 hypothetical protein [Streptomyces somaliensis]